MSCSGTYTAGIRHACPCTQLCHVSFTLEEYHPGLWGASSSVFKGLGKVFKTELPSVNSGLLQANEDEQKSSLLIPCSLLDPVGPSVVALTQQPLLVMEANSRLWCLEVSLFPLMSGFSSAMGVRCCRSSV